MPKTIQRFQESALIALALVAFSGCTGQAAPPEDSADTANLGAALGERCARDAQCTRLLKCDLALRACYDPCAQAGTMCIDVVSHWGGKSPGLSGVGGAIIVVLRKDDPLPATADGVPVDSFSEVGCPRTSYGDPHQFQCNDMPDGTYIVEAKYSGMRGQTGRIDFSAEAYRTILIEID